MALFKEIKCAHCGKKTSMLSRTQIMDDEYVCGTCTSGMPAETIALLHEYDSDDFANIHHFFNVENKERAKVFKETKKYKCVHLDEDHDLIYLDHVRPKMYFSTNDLTEFFLEYRPATVKEGFLSDKVTGDVHLTIKSDLPPYARQEIIAKDVKTTGEIKGLIKKKFTWNNPKGIDEINSYFTFNAVTRINDFLSSNLENNEELSDEEE